MAAPLLDQRDPAENLRALDAVGFGRDVHERKLLVGQRAGLVEENVIDLRETLDCVAVEFRTSSFNHASRRAIERLGARQDGVLRSHGRHKDGTVRDTVAQDIHGGPPYCYDPGPHHYMALGIRLFAALVFWSLCFGLSRYSARLDRTLSRSVEASRTNTHVN